MRIENTDVTWSRVSFSGKMPLLLLLYLMILAPGALPIGQQRYVESVRGHGSFPLANRGVIAQICIDPNDYPGVLRAANDLRDDLERVTGHAPTVTRDHKCAGPNVLLIGTVGKSEILDQLARPYQPTSQPLELGPGLSLELAGLARISHSE